METRVGGAGGDTFSSANSTGTTESRTLNAGDNLNGGAGIDRLSITNSITGGATLGAGVTTSSIEQLSVNAATATIIEAGTMAGITDVYSNGSVAALTINGLAALANVHVISTSSNVTAGFVAAATAGTADATTVLLNGSATTGNNTVTVSGVETINLVAAGTASGTADAVGGAAGFATTITADALTALNITGAAGVRVVPTLASTATTTGTITSAEGADDVTVNAGTTTKVSVDMGAGNDTVRLGGAPGVLAADPSKGAWTIAGGAGTDTLVTGSAVTSATTTGGNITGFEAVRLTAGVSVTLPSATNTISTVTFDVGGGTVAGVASGATVNVNGNGTSTVTNTTGWTGAADSITFNVGNSTTNTAFGPTTLSADLVETITVNNLARSGNTDARDITLTPGTTAAMKSLTINALGALTLTATATTLTTVNASGVAGNLTYNTSAAAASITGGAGNDTLGTAATASGADTIDGGLGNDAISGGAGADSLIGGGGADTITGGTGADTMTGGDGADRFVFSANDVGAATPVVVSSAQAPDTITDFVSGTDKISGTGAVAFLGNFTNIQAALARQAQAGTLANSAAFVQNENSLYVFRNTNGTLNVDDIVVKLTSVTTLAEGDLLLGTQGNGNQITLGSATASVSTTSSTGATVTTGVTTNSPADSTLMTDLNDTVSTTLANVAATASVNAGGGLDTLALSIAATAGADGQATAAELANFTNFETFTLANRASTTAAGNVNWDVSIAVANVNDNSTLTITSFEDGLNADGSLATWGTKITAAALTNTGGGGGTGTNRKVNITGSSAQDSIVGGAGNDTLTGGAGNDRLEGGTGTNVLSGGDGDDAIISTSLTDSIDGGTGNDTVTLITGAYTSTVAGGSGAVDVLEVVNGTSIAGATVSGFENLTIAANGAVTMTAAQLAGFTGTITAAGTETITLTGAGGSFTKPAAVEVIDATALTSAATISAVNAAGLKVSGSTATDITNTITLTGDVAADVSIVGGGANDVINIAHGATGTFTDADTITGGAGTDTLNVTGNIALTITVDGDFTGFEVINFAHTTAAVSFTTADATVAAAATLTVTTSQTTGALTFNGAAETNGKFSITGGGGDDVLTGGDGADTLNGGDGGDTIVGGAGADTINVGGGNNHARGGKGLDTITLGAGSNRVIIGDDDVVAASASLDTVTGLNLGALSSVAGADVIAIGQGVLINGDAASALAAGAGAVGSAAAGAAVLHVITPGVSAAVTANATVFHVTGTTGTTLTSALNGATVTGVTTGTSFVVAYYDADLNGGSLVVSQVFTGGDTTVAAGDTEVILLTGAMTATEYAALNVSNFVFI